MRALINGLLGCSFLLGPMSGAAEDQTLRYYDVCVNGQCTGAVPVLAMANSRWLVDVQALSSLGIDATSWAGQQHEGRRYTDLAARFPVATIRLDEQTQSLHFQLPAQAWPEHSVSQRRRWSRPLVTPSRVLSAFINYSLGASTGRSLDGYAESGVVLGPWLMRSALTWNREGGMRRGRTSLEFDQPLHQRRWIAGDQNTYLGDAFGSNGRIVGLGVFRAYDLTPGFTSFPGADIRGEMQAPGSVDVYSDGRLIAHEQLPPGPFSLRDLVLPRGLNDLRLVVHDPFAGTYELTDTFYSSPRTLKQGLHEFDDRIGRIADASLNDEMGRNPVLVSLNHRYGITNFATAGVRFEAFNDRRNMGASLDLQTRWGSFASAIAQSHRDGSTGLAWNLVYGYERRGFALNLGLRKQSTNYETLFSSAQSTSFARSIEDRHASISFPLGNSARAFARRLEHRYADGQQTSSTDLDLVWRISRGAQASLRVGHRAGTVAPGKEINLSIRANLGRDTADVSFRQRSEARDYRLAAQRSAPTDRGWGYRASVSGQSGRWAGQASLDRVSAYGRSFFQASSVGGRAEADIRHSGGLLWAQGQVFATQSDGQGYAIVRTNLTDVPVLRENVPVARSNRQGIALIPGLQPYQANAISVDTSGLDAAVLGAEERVYASVSRKGVSVVQFNLRAAHGVQAFLGVRTGGSFHRIKSGKAVLGQSSGHAEIGREGQVYFENVSAGRHRIFASADGKRFICEIDVPADGQMAWLGEVACATE